MSDGFNSHAAGPRGPASGHATRFIHWAHGANKILEQPAK